MSRRSVLAPLVLAALVLVAPACSGDGDDGSASAEDRPAAIAELVASGEGLPDGEQLYNSTCATCHGGDGQGAIGPQLAGVVADKYTPEQHIAIVLNGRGGMPAFASSLDDDELAAIVKYEREDLGE